MSVEKIKAFQIDVTEIATVPALNDVDASAKIYDVAGGISGLPVGNTTVSSFVIVRDVSFPSNLSGSVSKAQIASTGMSVFSIEKNGTQFATLTFNSSAVGIFNGAATTFTSGDILSVVTPPLQDTTLSDVYYTLSGMII